MSVGRPRFGRPGRRAAPAGHGRAPRHELDRAMEAIEREYRSTLAAVRLQHLRALAARGCPVRRIEPAPVPGAVRIRFADGTAVLAETAETGPLLGLLPPLSRGEPVLLDTVGPGPEGPRIVLTARRRTVGFVVTGWDQSD